MSNLQEHECDLFLMTSHHKYRGNNILESFAKNGKRNMDGWGIAAYNDGEVKIIKSEKPAVKSIDDDFTISKKFGETIEKMSGNIVLGHLRLASRGDNRVENNHPYKLTFLGHEWSLIHNGTGRQMDELVPAEERILLESDNDSPRVFEFLSKRIVEYYHSSDKKSIIEACRQAFGELLDSDPGTFNIILSNGYLSFVFIQHRPFFLLKRMKDSGDVAILSTMKLVDDEEWVKFNVLKGKRAKMLVFCGELLVLNGNVD